MAAAIGDLADLEEVEGLTALAGAVEPAGAPQPGQKRMPSPMDVPHEAQNAMTRGGGEEERKRKRKRRRGEEGRTRKGERRGCQDSGQDQEEANALTIWSGSSDAEQLDEEMTGEGSCRPEALQTASREGAHDAWIELVVNRLTPDDVVVVECCWW
jgi:hypothetical protein